GTYTKKSNEDFNSILTGIMQPKGDVHFHFGNLLTKEDLMPYQNLSNSKFNKQVAELIDYQICRNYKLTCNNYIAHDIRSKSNRYATFYTLEEKERFKLRMQQLATFECEDRHTLMEIFLGIYANPVDAKHRY
ncbi:MAG: acyltransferase, partial [Bacteroidales bacterium]|nr:acyltransferase [Bacteroidales bacterium]